MRVDDKLLDDIADKLESINGYINIIYSNLANLNQPESPSCCNVADLRPEIKSAMQKLDNLKNDINKSKNEISGISDRARNAERIAIGMTIDGSLLSGLSYYESSMGEGKRNTIGSGNIFASENDKFIVKYIAIYDGDNYVANIYGDQNNGKTLDEIIEDLKKDGKITSVDNIKIAKGIARADDERTHRWRYWLVRARGIFSK